MWNDSDARYGALWYARVVPFKLEREPLDMSSISAVRDRLIVVWRICQLYRSIDLARTVRAISFSNGVCYILTKRKTLKNFFLGSGDRQQASIGH